MLSLNLTTVQASRLTAYLKAVRHAGAVRASKQRVTTRRVYANAQFDEAEALIEKLDRKLQGIDS